jgi:uncharacterized LabA/DUF88 family protein
MAFLSGSTLTRVHYTFIDGAYLTELLVELGERYFKTPLQIDYWRLASSSQKIFYYDSLPARKGSESDDDFAIRLEEKDAHFAYLRSLDRWHVREGVGRWNKKRGANQKEVDILIAVDMLKHAHRRNMDELTFIAGDLDFRPLLDTLVEDGMHVGLWYGAHNTNQELVNASDSKVAIDIFWMHTFCTETFKMLFPLPERMAASRMDSLKVEQIASRNGVDVAWLERRHSQWILWTGNPAPGGGWFKYIYHEPKLLLHVHDASYGPHEWRHVEP